jgi:hypothetical protein
MQRCVPGMILKSAGFLLYIPDVPVPDLTDLMHRYVPVPGTVPVWEFRFQKILVALQSLSLIFELCCRLKIIPTGNKIYFCCKPVPKCYWIIGWVWYFSHKNQTEVFYFSCTVNIFFKPFFVLLTSSCVMHHSRGKHLLVQNDDFKTS